MKRLLTTLTTSMSQLKQSPVKVLEEAKGEPVAVLNRNKTVAYLVPADAVEPVDYVALEDCEHLIDAVISDNAVALDNLKDR